MKHLATALFVKESRMRSGYTQVELARKMNWGGPQSVSQIERGLVSLPMNRFKKFCRITNADKRALVEAVTEDARLKARRAVGLL